MTVGDCSDIGGNTIFDEKLYDYFLSVKPYYYNLFRKTAKIRLCLS